MKVAKTISNSASKSNSSKPFFNKSYKESFFLTKKSAPPFFSSSSIQRKRSLEEQKNKSNENSEVVGSSSVTLQNDSKIIQKKHGGKRKLGSTLFSGNLQIERTVNRGTEYAQGEGHIIGLGAGGEFVLLIQTALNLIYETHKNYTPLIIDGVFGPNTKNAVLNFQKDFGLREDGAVGPDTIKKMDIELTLLDNSAIIEKQGEKEKEKFRIGKERSSENIEIMAKDLEILMDKIEENKTIVLHNLGVLSLGKSKIDNADNNQTNLSRITFIGDLFGLDKTPANLAVEAMTDINETGIMAVKKYYNDSIDEYIKLEEEKVNTQITRYNIKVAYFEKALHDTNSISETSKGKSFHFPKKYEGNFPSKYKYLIGDRVYAFGSKVENPIIRSFNDKLDHFFVDIPEKYNIIDPEVAERTLLRHIVPLTKGKSLTFPGLKKI